MPKSRVPGSVRQTRSGKWQVVIQLPSPKRGERGPQLTRSYPTRGEAEQGRLDLIRTYLDPRAGSRGERMTVAVLLERWLTHQEGRVAVSTLATYRRYVNNRIVPNIGARPLHLLQVDELDDLYHLLLRDMKRNSVRQVHAIIRAALTWAVKRRYVDMNVAQYADPPAAEKSKIAPPTLEQVRRLREVAEEQAPWFGVAVRLSAATGARRGTVACFRQSDFLFTTNEVLIDRSYTVVAGKKVVKGLKADTGGLVVVGSSTMNAVASHIARLHERATAAGVVLPEDFYLFSTHVDCSEPVDPMVLTKMWRQARETAGFPNVRLHDLRHFVPTKLLADGFDAVTVADRLKHASAKMTLDVYGHVTSERARQAGEWLDRELD